ncbi:hypothetical protein JRO89_XS05G0248400 [Xanthoceras sorbifolium]|uniref:C2H2-type domain-containing protein n=1 Tax=Xanthoceras sorbifolium TaxID=99658 RepID=A0ABQ8I3H0_9ROSI|nr:hypothetical protein JRO89_XS05G0248400 [Xanthoceras sorbifolium]
MTAARSVPILWNGWRMGRAAIGRFAPPAWLDSDSFVRIAAAASARPTAMLFSSPSYRALGDYTRMISDFSVLPSDLREGRVGPYWYHEDTQAFFDDMDQYKMIKAMCRLSCSVCDNMEDQLNDGSKRRGKFRNIEQLKGHLFHQHNLVMCSLCLEGRKVFICEQKLYTRAQLKQHINTGDSEVDGSESERGGFMGHPMCEFCKTPFYGDNELYSHMSTEHYTCHICQRQHPGQYEYYKNYDDLEAR